MNEGQPEVIAGSREVLPVTAGRGATTYVPLAIALGVLLFAVPLVIRGLNYPVAEPHFGLLAKALLHGRLDIAAPVYDGVVHDGRTYLPFGPFPALLMLPAVLVAGSAFPVLWLGLAVVAIAAAGFWRLWPALEIHATPDRLWLTLGALAGTAVLSAAVVNSGYFVAHLVVIACLVWALVLALEGRAPVLCGVLVGLAIITRTSSVLAVVALAGLYWHRSRRPGQVAALLAPVVPALLLLAAYNAARFGSPLESGYGQQVLANPDLIALRAQGLFSLNHVPRNLYYLLVAPPGPGLAPSPWGMGLLFVSPWVLGALWARGRQAGWLAAGLVLTVLPSLLYYGVGWIQFGYRYGLDGLPFLAGLAAIGYRWQGMRVVLPALVLVSVVVNVAGAGWLLTELGA
jgi:hypothetical protein